jgi:hypothetical protein
VSPPLSKGSAPLDAETIAVLKAEIARKGMSADKLRARLVPPPSGATFWRALHGEKVSKPVQAACVDMAKTLRNYQRPVEVAYDFDPDPEAA